MRIRPGLLTAVALVVLAASPGAARADEAATWMAKGDAAFAAKRYQEAAGHYRGAAAAAPDATEPRYRLGVALAATGDLEGAIAAWELVLLVDPRHEKARRNIDLARARLARLDRGTRDEASVLAQARGLLADGRAATALLLLDGLLADPMHAQHPEALAMRGAARLATGDPAGASDDFLALLALAPHHPDAWSGLAAAYAALGDSTRSDQFQESGTVLSF